MKAAEGVAFFQMGGIGLSLYPVQDLCAEAGVHWRGHGGFGGIALSHNVRTRAEVDEVVAAWTRAGGAVTHARSEEHTSELQSLMRISYAVFCLKKKNIRKTDNT